MKMFLFFPYYLTIVLLTAINIHPQLDNDEKIKTASIQQLFENRNEKEKKVSSNLFYQLIEYKRGILENKNESTLINDLKSSRPLCQFYENKTLIKLRLTEKDTMNIGEVIKELNALDCIIMKIYPGYKNYIQISVWMDYNSIYKIIYNDKVNFLESQKKLRFN